MTAEFIFILPAEDPPADIHALRLEFLYAAAEHDFYTEALLLFYASPVRETPAADRLQSELLSTIADRLNRYNAARNRLEAEDPAWLNGYAELLEDSAAGNSPMSFADLFRLAAGAEA